MLHLWNAQTFHLDGPGILHTVSKVAYINLFFVTLLLYLSRIFVIFTFTPYLLLTFSKQAH